MNILQITPVNATPPVHGSDHRSHGIVSAFPSCGSEIRRYSQSLKVSNYKSIDLRRKVVIKDGYTEIRSLNPLFRIIRLPSSLLNNQSANRNLAKILKYYIPRKLSRLLRWSDIIIVERSANHVIILNELVDNIPIIYSVHSLNKTSSQQEGINRSRAVIYPSEETRSIYRSRYEVGCEEYIIPNGVYADKIRDSFSESKPHRLIEKYNIGDDSLICLFVGSRFEENVESAKLLAKVAASNLGNPNVHALIVGKVGNAIDASNSNITTTGFVNNLEEHYNLADIGFNIIQRPEGGVSFKLLDYLARAIPVVTSEEGTYGLELVNGEHVFITNIRNKKKLRTKIQNLGADRDLMRKFSLNGKEYIKRNHTWEKISTEYHESLLKILSQGDGSSY